jgi:hypothetical protein
MGTTRPAAGAPEEASAADETVDANAGSGASEGTATSGPTQNELFDVLSNRRRRYALHVLTRRGEPVELGPLADRVAAWENGRPVDEVTSAQRKRVYTALQQSHLPKLDEVGVVEFDKASGVIAPTRALERIDVYLDVVQGNEIPWSEYYLGLSAVGVALVAGAWVDAPVLGSLPPLALAGGLAAVFLLSAVGHLYHSRSVRLGGRRTPADVE